MARMIDADEAIIYRTHESTVEVWNRRADNE